jgi:hypothetical protein
LGYYANTTAYAKNCVNKDKPIMHCCGKCQLRKKLQQEEKDRQSPYNRPDNKNEIFFSPKSFFVTLLPSFGAQEDKIKYADLFYGKELKMPRSVFHPPAV